MNCAALATRTFPQSSTEANRSSRLTAQFRNELNAKMPQKIRCQASTWSRLALLSALVLGATSGVARAQSLVATLPSGPSPTSVVVNPTTNMAYVSDNNVGTLTVVNGATNTATTLTTGEPNITGLAVNPTTNTIYALYLGSQQSTLGGTVVTPGGVVVIDGANNTVTTTIALPDLGSHIAVNPVTNKIYVSTLSAIGNGATVNVRVIDGATNTITASVSLPLLVGTLAVDSVSDVIYAIYSNPPGNGTLAAIDGATNTVTGTIQVGYNDNTFALNGTTNSIYVPDAHGNQIYVIDGATLTITTTVPGTTAPVAVNASGLAVNPVTNLIYVTVYNNNTAAGAVQVMDGSTNTLTTNISVPPTSGPFGLGQLLANSVTNKIWMAASPVVFIDGVTNTSTTVTGTSGITMGALNTTTNYAYMAGPNNVYVLSGAASGPAFSAAPSPLAFGNQTQGTTSNAKTLTVTNAGTSDLTFTTVTPGGTDMSDFPVGSDTCANATVAVGKTCTVSVEFDPSTTAAESATLTFADNASDSPQVVNLTGTGVAPVATATTTGLSASATSVVIGTSVTLTATVSPASGTPDPTGTVTFKDGATTLGTGTLNGSGVATYTASALSLAAHSITASYAGDARNLASASSALTVTVTAEATTTALTASSPSAVVGSGITFTATVAGTSGGPTPTGLVTFMDGATTLGPGTLNGSGVATYSTSSLAVGAHSIVANYGGDANNAASASTAVSVTVWAGTPDFTLAASSASGTVKAGKSEVVTITVTSVNGFGAATNLAIAGLPKNSVATLTPTSVSPTTATAGTSTLTITTDKKAKAALEKTAKGSSAPGGPQSRKFGEMALTGLALLILPILGAKNRKARRLLLTISAFAILAWMGATGMTGCTSGPKTPTGTYTITITATSGSLSHNVTYSLTVQ